jgi:hypothetical protein
MHAWRARRCPELGGGDTEGGCNTRPCGATSDGRDTPVGSPVTARPAVSCPRRMRAPCLAIGIRRERAAPLVLVLPPLVACRGVSVCQGQRADRRAADDRISRQRKSQIRAQRLLGLSRKIGKVERADVVRRRSSARSRSRLLLCRSPLGRDDFPRAGRPATVAPAGTRRYDHAGPGQPGRSG